MPRIVFGGKVYNNEFEMPADIRQAYQEKQKQEKNNSEQKAIDRYCRHGSGSKETLRAGAGEGGRTAYKIKTIK